MQQPQNRFYYVKPPFVLYPGSGIAGAIDFSNATATDVVDEVTARQNVGEFSKFANSVRKEREDTWQQYWQRKRELANKILSLELEAYNESQQIYADEDFSDDESGGRRHRIQPVPITFPTPGAFDLPKPDPVIIPDPRYR